MRREHEQQDQHDEAGRDRAAGGAERAARQPAAATLKRGEVAPTQSKRRSAMAPSEQQIMITEMT